MSDDTGALSWKPPLPVDLDYVTEDLRIRAQTELSEDEDKVAQGLQLLRSLLEKEQNLRWQDDDLFLLAFLRARKFDVDRAFSLVKGFYANLGKHADLYYNVDFDRLKEVMEENTLDFLPYRDREGSVVFIYLCGVWDPSTTRAEENFLCNFLGIVQALRSPPTQIAGFKLIADFRSYKTSHLFHITPFHLKFFINMLQNALPARMQGLHVVNQSFLFCYLWAVGKIFLSKKLRNRIHVHGSDMKSLHKFFHPSILPANLEGELPPFDNALWRQRMESSFDYLKHVLSFGYEDYLNKDWEKKKPTAENSQSQLTTS